MGISTKVKRVFRRRSLSRIPREPGRGDPGWGSGPEGGVREPRNPQGNPPADAISLPEPK
jgi:hypothetical protein